MPNRPSTAKLIQMLAEHSHPLFRGGTYDLTLVGLRRLPETANVFDDLIGAVYQDEAGRWQSEMFVATTDPGLPWLLQPSRPDGCAILRLGHYKQCWAPGKHRGKYDALVQVKPMTFTRDGNRDAVLDYDAPVVEHETIGCNLHRAAAHELVGAVDLYSAGCQVIRNIDDFDHLMDLCRFQREHGHGDRFSYSLMPWDGKGEEG